MFQPLWVCKVKIFQFPDCLMQQEDNQDKRSTYLALPNPITPWGSKKITNTVIRMQQTK